MASLTNSRQGYGWVSIVLHWLMALPLIGMHFLGDYMIGLDYYHIWYHKAPALHKAIGMVLAMLLIVRVIWSLIQVKPASLEKSLALKTMASMAHLSLYLLIVLIVITGYLVSTAKGAGVDVFGLVSIPAFITLNKDQATFAGEIHALGNTVFMALVLLHIGAALAHHFFLKDQTFIRMLWARQH